MDDPFALFGQYNANKSAHNNNKICLSCGKNSIIIDESNSALICSNCGVQRCSQILDRNLESIYNEDVSSRCNSRKDKLLPNMSQATCFVGKNSRRINAIHMWQTMNYKELSLINVFKLIDNRCQDSNISNAVIAYTKNLYHSIIKEKDDNDDNRDKIYRGDKRTGIIAACVYWGCVVHKPEKSVKEISKMFEIKEKTVNTGIDILSSFMLKNKILDNDVINDCKDIVSYTEYYIKKLNITEPELIKKINSIAQIIEERKHEINNMTRSIATGIIYYGLLKFDNKKINKKHIAEVCDISEVTMNKCYKTISTYEPLFKYI